MLDYKQKIANLESQAKEWQATHQQLTAQINEATSTLLRIQGAVQILQECQRELDEAEKDTG